MATAIHSNIVQYLLILDDGRELEVSAIGNEQAIGLCQKQYPNTRWKLYRLEAGERIPVCTKSPQCKE
jgi:hypothetical protein